MDENLVWKARGEAERFLKRVAEFSTHIKENDGRDHRDHYACPERAAIRRASLDLTRALARMRKG